MRKSIILFAICLLATVAAPVFSAQGGPKPRSLCPPRPTQTCVGVDLKQCHFEGTKPPCKQVCKTLIGGCIK